MIDLGSPTAGNIAAFITGAAAVVGLTFAAWEVKRSTDQRKGEAKRLVAEERTLRESMARAVGVDVKVVDELGNRGAIQVTVLNSGRYPIEKVEVIAATQPAYAETLFDAPDQFVSRHPLGTVLPGSQKGAGPAGPPGVGHEDIPVAVTFRDTWDQKWVKVWNGDLSMVIEDLPNTTNT